MNMIHYIEARKEWSFISDCQVFIGLTPIFANRDKTGYKMRQFLMGLTLKMRIHKELVLTKVKHDS